MCHLISSNKVCYEKPCSYKLADRVYKDIFSVDSKTFIDNDGMEKSINYLDSPYSEHVAYVQNSKVFKTTENYRAPITRKLGDKIYSDIISKESIPGKYEVYTVCGGLDPNKIRVRANGSAIDIQKLKHEVMMRKMFGPLKNAAKNVMKMFA